jgi:hypothetical protein
MKWCLTHGFLIKKITEKYDDMVRAIVHLDMIKENLNIKCENNVIVPNNNIEVQKALLSSGYCGYELRRTDDGFNITYGKIKRMEWMY